MNRQQMLLLVARTLEKTFTPNDLIVAAWRRHPNEFGMLEYPYPCSNRSRPRIFGRVGIIYRGWVAWVDAEHTRLAITAKGRIEIGKLTPRG